MIDTLFLLSSLLSFFSQRTISLCSLPSRPVDGFLLSRLSPLQLFSPFCSRPHPVSLNMINSDPLGVPLCLLPLLLNRPIPLSSSRTKLCPFCILELWQDSLARSRRRPRVFHHPRTTFHLAGVTALALATPASATTSSTMPVSFFPGGPFSPPNTLQGWKSPASPSILVYSSLPFHVALPSPCRGPLARTLFSVLSI